MKTISSAFLAVFMMATLFACAQKTKKYAVVEKKLNDKELAKYSQATFAAGCFWHEEAMFESIKGVKEAVSGYAGGATKNPTYETIETGETGHAESVTVYYDSSVVSYPTLVKIYFAGQNPTQVNGQGPDHGMQYRSILFYRTASEKQAAEAYVKTLQSSGKFKAPIAAQLMPLTKFWKAEDYHQDFISKNPGQGYVNMVSIPEIKKLQKELPQYIKPDHIF